MVTEHIEKGGLSTLLHGHGGKPLPGSLTMPQVIWLSLGMARGMQYLHACKVLHLDLKSPNVLVDISWTPKLCDFGLAKISGKETGEGGFQTTLRGVSPIWAPPEMFDDRADAMTEKADVYSYGIVFFEVASRQLPFQEISQRQLPKAKFEGVLPQIPKEIPEDCASLVKSCCAHKPGARPSMNGVVARLQDIATGRGLNLAEVVMPSWQRPEDSAEEQSAVRQLEERQARLREEKTRLLQELEQKREQRRRVQQAHLGTATFTESEPLLGKGASAAGAGGTAGGGAGAGAGRAAPDAPAAAAGSKKTCCRVM